MKLVSILEACPFAQWGIDLVGTLPRSTEHRKWIIVAIDYFSKALGLTTKLQVIKFLKARIISRYRIPLCWLVTMDHNVREKTSSGS